MKSLFISQLSSQEIIQKYKCSQAAFNFCCGIVSTRYFRSVFSIIPTQVVEKLPQRYNEVENIQVRFFPHKINIFRFLNTFFETVICVWRSLSFEKIWFYNVNKHLLFTFLILKFLFRKKVFVILADFDEKADSVFSAAWWCAFSIRHADGCISLSSRGIFGGQKNTAVIPGIIRQGENTTQVHSRPFSKKALFSGSLVKAWGIDLAIDVFSALPDWDLYISGVLSDKDKKFYGRKIKPYVNIHYLGFLPFDKYLSLLGEIDCCLSLRDPAAFQNQNNFPSKILEFLSNGKEVISTIQYPELVGVDYTSVAFDKDALTMALCAIENLSEEERFARREKNKGWLLSHVSGSAWCATLRKIEENA